MRWGRLLLGAEIIVLTGCGDTDINEVYGSEIVASHLEVISLFENQNDQLARKDKFGRLF